MDINVEIKEDYPVSQWYHVKIILPGYGYDPIKYPNAGVFYLINADTSDKLYEELGISDPCFRPEIAKTIKRKLEM